MTPDGAICGAIVLFIGDYDASKVCVDAEAAASTISVCPATGEANTSQADGSTDTGEVVGTVILPGRTNGHTANGDVGTDRGTIQVITTRTHLGICRNRETTDVSG